MDQFTKRTMAYAGAGLGALWIVKELTRQKRSFSFKGKTVLITGGARGLGLVTARHLAKAGANLAICSRDIKALEKARNELLQVGGRVLAIPCDVTNRVQVESLISTVASHFGRLDVLINNAGIIEVGPMQEMRFEDYDEAMNTHFWGASLRHHRCPSPFAAPVPSTHHQYRFFRG